MGSGSSYLLTLQVTPYIGLAYFDGIDDGSYDDHLGYQVADLTNGNYPNLYANGHDIGNFIPAAPIVLDGTGITPGSVVLEIYSSSDHCPVINAVQDPFTNPLPIHFDLFGGGLAVLPDEQELLAEFGKVFFYYCEVIDPVTNATIWSGYMMPPCNAGDATYWA